MCLFIFFQKVMSSSWCSAWITETPSRRWSSWRGRSLRPSHAYETKPRRTWTFRWSSAATSVTETFTERCRRRRSSSWSVETSTAPTLKSQRRRTPTWTRCFRVSSPWPSCPTKWVPTDTARFPCSTARFCTKSPSETRGAKTGTRTGLWHRLHADPACTVTWCTLRRRLLGAVRPKRKAASYADMVVQCAKDI